MTSQSPSNKGTGQKKSPHKHYVPEVEKADATGLFFVVLHEVGLYLGMIFYFEFPKLLS